MYVIDSEGKLRLLSETPYELEAHLQQLVAEYPDLLGGDQINLAEPRRFLLIESEAGLAISETSGNLFSIDLLFIDQDGLPTLVEVKRSSDTRIRREVTAQLLEYAANFVQVWNSERMRRSFEDRCQSANIDPKGEAGNVLAVFDDDSYDLLWAKVTENVSQGKLRLMMVADDIPLTTLRIVEFLNDRMDKTEVYAVRVSQHVGGGVRTLSTSVLNRSQEIVERKALKPRWADGAEWTAERFSADLLNRGKADAIPVMDAIVSWAAQRRHVVLDFGRGLRDGSRILTAVETGKSYQGGPNEAVFVTLWSYGSIEIDFQWLKYKVPFRDRDKRLELQQRLNLIPGVVISEEQIDKRPNLNATLLVSGDVFDSFKSILEWIILEFEAAWLSASPAKTQS